MPTGLLSLPTEIHERIFDLLRRSYIQDYDPRYDYEDGMKVLPMCKELVRVSSDCWGLSRC